MTNFPKDPQAVEINPEAAHPSDNFAENLQLFWLKNRNLILGCCSAVLLAIVAKGGYDMYVEHREKVIGQEYAEAGNAADKLNSFAKAHEGHALAGAAYLRVADEAYAGARYLEAQLAYDKSLPCLEGTPFLSRAKLGSAMSLVLQGKAAEGETALRALLADTNQFKGIRAEAGYHLATHLVAAGKPDEAGKVIDQLMLVDTGSVWVQRALMLRSELPQPAAAPAATEKQPEEPKLSLPVK